MRGLITANHAAPNSEVVLRCAEGLRDAEGPCEPAHLRCSGGAWHGRAPVCVEFDGCVALPGIPRGSLLGLSDDGRYSVGSRVVFTCQPGYRLHGQPIFSCESSGCWSPTMLPECLPEFYLPSGWEEYALSPGAALLASLGTALAVMALLLAVCLAVVCRRRRRSPRHTSSSSSHAARRLRWPADEGAEAPIQTAPPAALIPPDPDRVALIAFADGLQSVLPSYEEATRGGSGGGAGTGVLYGALHRGRGPHWTALGSGGGGGRRGRRERHAAPPLQDGDTLSHHSLHGCTRQSSSHGWVHRHSGSGQ
ncbi:hypothetical protein B566_EDAN000824 [Ephemera danica]|nr:hypothetical protein B566_EDAN000824 [Ephemera danica]